MSSIVEIEARIKLVKSESITIEISSHEGLSNKRNVTVRPDQILFRNSPAPQNLLSKGTIVKLKYDKSKLISISIDQTLDIQAYFGKIIEIDSMQEKINISISFMMYEISFNQLAHIDNRPIVKDLIITYKNTPVILYFNSESPIEARLLHNDWKKNFKLDSFSKTPKNEEETEFFVLKDQRLVPHKIVRESVFYKSFEYHFDTSKVKYNVGAEVEVSIYEQNVIGFVMTRSSLSLHSKNSNSSLNLNSAEIVKKPQTVNFDDNFKGKKKEYPINGKRVLIFREPYCAYFKENKSFNDIGTVILALLEVCYRFPELKIRNLLYQQFSYALGGFEDNKFKNSLNAIFSISRKNRELSSLENFYKIASEQSAQLEYYGRFFIENEYNFSLISNTYNICIYVSDSTLSTWQTFQPLFNTSPIPVIYFRRNSKLEIIYKEETMKYDGYNELTLEYTEPVDVDPALLFHQNPKNPDFSILFSNIAKITEMIENKRLANMDELNQTMASISASMNQMSVYIPEEHKVNCEESYKKILQFKLDDKKIYSRCNCGKEIGNGHSCGEHNMCKECAFVSSRLGKCVVCHQSFCQTVEFLNIHCSNCGHKYDDKYFFAFSCHCILCTACIHKVIGNRQPYCFKNHQLTEFDYNNSYKFLLNLGYRL